MKKINVKEYSGQGGFVHNQTISTREHSEIKKRISEI